jgi:hypothetical protein
MTHNEFQLPIDFKILIPELILELELIDFSERKHQLFKQSLVTPAFTNFLDVVGDGAVTGKGNNLADFSLSIIRVLPGRRLG